MLLYYRENYFILSIIAFTKLMNDKKNKLETKYTLFIIIDLCMLVFAFLIFIVQCIHNYFFFKKENLEKFNEKIIGLRKEKIKREIVLIEKFKGFKIDIIDYNFASNFKPLKYSTIKSLLKNDLFYTISSEQSNLIDIINNFRKKIILEN